ncbi:nuclear transport factor 2 family protein, partial [Striga asiatica]
FFLCFPFLSGQRIFEFDPERYLSKIYMATRNPSSSYKLQSLLTMFCRYRAVSGGLWRSNQAHHREPPPYMAGRGGLVDEGLRFLSVSSRQYTQPMLGKMKWLLGSILSMLLPLWNNKWDKLLKLEVKATKVVDEVEAVAEVVAEVAATADKALAEVAKQLPDNSKLKEAAQVMEHVSNVAAQEAKLVEDIIHKVGDLKQNLEDLDAMVEPIVEKMTKGDHTKI